MAYTTLWALVICLFRFAVKLKEGTHTLAAAQLSQVLMLIVTGLLFVAIGLPITLVVGEKRQAVPISLGCFFVGFIAIPTLIVILLTLDGLGVINVE